MYVNVRLHDRGFLRLTLNEQKVASSERLFKVMAAKALCLSFILLLIHQIHFIAQVIKMYENVNA